MANSSRNPTSQRFTFVSPIGTTSGAPGWPNPGPAAQDRADALPLLAFTPGPSLCLQPNLTAVGGNPGVAGPVATMPTTNWQDFGQPMGQTGLPNPQAGYVDGSDND